MALPGMVHMVVVRSPYAHARVEAISTERARGAPGVLAVVTGRDLEGRVHPLPVEVREGAQIAAAARHPLLATDRVRYVGQPVAVVVAETRVAALEAALLVELTCQPLPPVTDPHHALRGGVRLHDAVEDNGLLRWSRSGGDVAAAFQSAQRIVRGQFHLPRLAAAPIETRGALAAYDRGADLVTIWLSAQDPHRPRSQLSRVLGRPEDRIRIIVPDVGGAFGSKGALAPESALAAVIAMDLGRPVHWIEDRRENLAASYQGRGLDAEVEMAVRDDGRILGVRARLVADLGAYLLPSTAIPAITTGMLLTGAYDIPAASVELVGAATNKVPLGPYRGAGRPEAAFVVERMVDLIAQELGLDPVEVRRRNFIPPERFPYPTPLGFTYDSGNYAQALDRALERIGYDRWRHEQRRARTQGRLIGIGLAVYVERAGSGLWESAAVLVDPSGRVIVRPGSTSHGQGHETTFAQIAADILGVAPQDVVVEQGDSAMVPRGVGTFASRSVATGGSALVVALEKIKAKAIRIAAHLLEAAEDDIAWERGHLHVRGTPERTVSFQQVAAAAYTPARLPRTLEPGLSEFGFFSLPGPVFPFGAYAVVVEVDRETGQVRVLQVVAVDDAGRIINPLLAEGQVIGSTVQGLAEALVEEVRYDEAGQLLTATLADYGLLRAPQVPPVHSEFLETPSPFNPLGAKGIGEAGTIGTPAAVANAVVDALSPLGVRHVDLPLSAEKLWRIVQIPRG